MEEDWGMVERKGTQLVVNNQPFFVNGFNTYWLMVFAVDHTTRKKVSEVFREAAAIGLTVCRTWAFNDGGWRALQTSPFVYVEEVFKVLDFLYAHHMFESWCTRMVLLSVASVSFYRHWILS